MKVEIRDFGGSIKETDWIIEIETGGVIPYANRSKDIERMKTQAFRTLETAPNVEDVVNGISIAVVIKRNPTCHSRKAHIPDSRDDVGVIACEILLDEIVDGNGH